MSIIVKSFSVGNGDMFYINHGSDNFTSIDCCYSTDEERDEDFEEIRRLASNKSIRRFISTHPDEDHIKGIEKFDEVVGIENFYCVQNEATKKEDESDSFKAYCGLRDDSEVHYFVEKGCSRRWMNLSDDSRGSSGINFFWPDVSNEDFKDALTKAKDGEEFNNISPIFTYSISEGPRFMWMGDIEHDFVEKIKDHVMWPIVDVLFAPHHGRKSGRVPSDVLEKIRPGIIVVGEAPSKDLEYYAGYNTLTQNSTGDIVFECSGEKVRVYVENEEYAADFLEDEGLCDCEYGHYIGSYAPRC